MARKPFFYSFEPTRTIRSFCMNVIDPLGPTALLQGMYLLGATVYRLLKYRNCDRERENIKAQQRESKGM